MSCTVSHVCEARSSVLLSEAKVGVVHRMGKGICTSPVAESIYCDILGNLERMGDHCYNVGRSVTSRTTSDISDDEIVELQAVRNA